MSEQNNKSLTVGDLASGAGKLLKRGIEAVREGGAQIQKADLSPAHVKETVSNTPINKILYWAFVAFCVVVAFKVVAKPLLKSLFR